MPKNRKILGMIPARFGSTRFPGKPLVLIGGKTLIQRTYENAKKCKILDEVAIATDDERIFSHVTGFGGLAVMTSPSCPTGSERIAEAIEKDKHFAGFEVIVNIQGDEPLLQADVIESVVNKLIEDKTAAMSTAVVKIADKEEAENYSTVKCVMDQHGNALYFSRTLIPNGHSGKWRPEVSYYRHLGIYCYRRDFLLKYATLPQTPLQKSEDLEQLKVLENGYKIKVAIVDSIALGVDRPEDVNKIEKLL